MDCNRVVENLVESARERQAPSVAARAHMSSCGSCAERWDSEQALDAALHAVRADARSRRSPAASRRELERQFAFANRRTAIRRWAFGFTAVAALAILSITVLRPSPQGPAAEVASFSGDVPMDPESEGFLAVPFVPPLGEGEMMRMVHTELHPAALAELGISVDPSWYSELQADLLVGADGFPRAVRVSDEQSGSGGF